MMAIPSVTRKPKVSKEIIISPSAKYGAITIPGAKSVPATRGSSVSEHKIHLNVSISINAVTPVGNISYNPNMRMAFNTVDEAKAKEIGELVANTIIRLMKSASENKAVIETSVDKLGAITSGVYPEDM